MGDGVIKQPFFGGWDHNIIESLISDLKMWVRLKVVDIFRYSMVEHCEKMILIRYVMVDILIRN